NQLCRNMKIVCFVFLIAGLLTADCLRSLCDQSVFPPEVKIVRRGSTLKVFCPSGLRPLEADEKGVITPSREKFARYSCIEGQYKRLYVTGVDSMKFFCAGEFRTMNRLVGVLYQNRFTKVSHSISSTLLHVLIIRPMVLLVYCTVHMGYGITSTALYYLTYKDSMLFGKRLISLSLFESSGGKFVKLSKQKVFASGLQVTWIPTKLIPTQKTG
ncbi:uncharacterized protein DEA37_0002681, partial [Paragonimus westermani]